MRVLRQSRKPDFSILMNKELTPMARVIYSHMMLNMRSGDEISSSLLQELFKVSTNLIWRRLQELEDANLIRRTTKFFYVGANALNEWIEPP